MNIVDNSIIHVMSKDNTPCCYIDSGDIVLIKTESPKFTEKKFEEIRRTNQFPKRVLSITGPIYVKNCKKGDLLKITIENIQLDNIGKMWSGQWIGLLSDELNDCFLKEVTVRDNFVCFNDSLEIKIKPMIGTIGVAPINESVDCLIPGKHGGNMDVKELGIGSTLFLQAQVDGGLISVGDVHAIMGNGEVLGTGVEVGSIVTMKIECLKNYNFTIPLIENDDNYIMIFSDKTVESATKNLVKEAINMVMKINDYSFEDAFCIIGQFCDIGIAQLVNPLVTVTLTVPKKVLRNKLFNEYLL